MHLPPAAAILPFPPPSPSLSKSCSSFLRVVTALIRTSVGEMVIRSRREIHSLSNLEHLSRRQTADDRRVSFARQLGSLISRLRGQILVSMCILPLTDLVASEAMAASKQNVHIASNRLGGI